MAFHNRLRQGVEGSNWSSRQARHVAVHTQEAGGRGSSAGSSAGTPVPACGTHWPGQRPGQLACPLVACMNPSSMRIVVVLPAPLGPSRPKHSRRWTASDRSATATCWQVRGSLAGASRRATEGAEGGCGDSAAQ